MKRILIIGATGHMGRQVIAQPPFGGLSIRALVRHPDPAGLPSHVEAVFGDLNRPNTLDTCLDAIDTVFLVWVSSAKAVAPNLEQIVNIVSSSSATRKARL